MERLRKEKILPKYSKNKVKRFKSDNICFRLLIARNLKCNALVLGLEYKINNCSGAANFSSFSGLADIRYNEKQFWNQFSSFEVLL